MPAEPVLWNNCWILELEVTVVDILEGKPWLLSKICSDILKKDHGVDLLCKEDVEAKDKIFAKADSMRLELRVDKDMAEGRKAQDAKWCLAMASDRLRFWAARGPCCWRVFYDGPHPDAELSSKALVRQVVGEERNRLDEIEAETSVMVRLVPIKFEGGGEEKPASRLLVKLRGVEWKAVHEAERRVTLLLEERAGWRRTGNGGGGAIDVSHKAPLTHTKQQNGHENNRDSRTPKTVSDATTVVGEGYGRSSGSDRKTQSRQVEKTKEDTAEFAVKEEEWGSEVLPDPGSTRLLHVYDVKARGYTLESEISDMIEGVLAEMVEVGEGLLGPNERMVKSVTLLDSHLAQVEMGHEELAAACVELLKRDPTTFNRLVVENGPEEKWGVVSNSSEPRAPPGGIVTISNPPKGLSPRSVYNTIHRAAQGNASAGERERARKLTGGKLIMAIRSNGSEQGTLFVYFPTCELADKTFAAYEQEPNQFRGLVLNPPRGASKFWNHHDPVPSKKADLSALLRPHRRGTQGDTLQALPIPGGAYHGPTKSSPALTNLKALGSGWDVRPALNPDTAVFVNRLPQHASRPEVAATFSKVLDENCSRAELASADWGQVVVEVRLLTPHCAAIYLGSKSLTARALELYKQDERVFEGMVVKPYQTAESPKAMQGPSPRAREVHSRGVRPRGRGEAEEAGEGRRLVGTTVRSSMRGVDRGRADYRVESEEGIEYERGGGAAGHDGRRSERSWGGGYPSPERKKPRLTSPEAPHAGRGALRGDVLSSSRQREVVRVEKERVRMARVEADGFVRLNKERCVYFQKIPAHLAEATALEEVVTRWLGALGGQRLAPNGEYVSYVKLLKSGDAFVEFENRKCVERLLREPIGDRRRFEGMVMKEAV